MDNNFPAHPDESGMYPIASADMEDQATETEKDDFVAEFNEDNGTGLTYDDIIGLTSK